MTAQAMTAPVNFGALPAGAEKFSLAQHVIDRAKKRGYTVIELYMTAIEPDMVAPSKTDPRCAVHVRGDCKVVVNIDTGAIVTVTDSHLATERSRHRRAANAETWAEADRAAAATAAAAAALVRELRHQTMLDRVRRGSHLPPPPPPLRPDAAVVAELAATWRDTCLPQLKERAGQWAILDTDVLGLPTALAAVPGVELHTQGDTIRVRWAGDGTG